MNCYTITEQLDLTLHSLLPLFFCSLPIIPTFRKFSLVSFALLLGIHITKTMKNIEIPETKTASFECEVSHFNVPAIWLKNGVEIEMSEKFKIVVQGKLHQLNIMNTSSEDSAEYTFVCGNDRVSATLTVKRMSKLN